MDLEEMEKWSRGAVDYAEKAVDLEKIKREYREMFGVMMPL